VARSGAAEVILWYCRLSVGLLFVGAFAGCGRSASLSSSQGTPTDVSAITTAFNTWEGLPSSCLGMMNTESLKVALVSEVGWAIATFRPPRDCTKSLGPALPGGPPRTVPIASIGPWGESSPPLGVFERLPGSPWRMNEEGGVPFPCPAPGGAPPGPYNGALPPRVVEEFNLKYAPDCANVSYPKQRPPT